MTNPEIARQLRLHATALSRQGENLYRVRAFRQAALVVLSLMDPITELLETRGREALEEIPGIGPSIAETIETFVLTGLWIPRTPHGTDTRICGV